MAIEVTLLWHDVVLDVVVRDKSKPFTLGERRCDYPLPESILGAPWLTLVTFERGIPWVWIPPVSRVAPRTSSIAPQSTNSPRDAGNENAGRKHGTARRLDLGENTHVELGVLTIRVAHLVRVYGLRRNPLKFDFRLIAVNLGVAAVHLALVAWAAHCVPKMGELQILPTSEPLLVFADMRTDAFAIPEDDTGSTFRDLSSKKTPLNGVIGQDHAERRKHLGDRLSKPLKRSGASIRGPEDNFDPHVARRRALDPNWDTCWYGWDPALPSGEFYAPVARWGRDTSLGRDPFSAAAPEWSGAIASAQGDDVEPQLAAPVRLRKVLKLVGVKPLVARPQQP